MGPPCDNRVMSNNGMMTRRNLLVGGAVSTCFAGAATVTAASGDYISDATPRFSNLLNGEQPPPEKTGIVIFTGETERIRRGLEMYMNGKADHALISGTVLTGEHRQLQRFCNNLGIAVTRPLDGIAVDGSRNTVDNGYNSAQWLRKNDLSYAVLVTSDYHMERSLIHLSRALSSDNVKIIQNPVTSNADLMTRMAERGKIAMARIGLSRGGTQF